MTCPPSFSSTCSHVRVSTRCHSSSIARIGTASTTRRITAATSTIRRSALNLGFWGSIRRSIACRGRLLFYVFLSCCSSHIRCSAFCCLSCIARIRRSIAAGCWLLAWFRSSSSNWLRRLLLRILFILFRSLIRFSTFCQFTLIITLITLLEGVFWLNFISISLNLRFTDCFSTISWFYRWVLVILLPPYFSYCSSLIRQSILSSFTWIIFEIFFLAVIYIGARFSTLSARLLSTFSILSFRFSLISFDLLFNSVSVRISA